jgi:hypothetical protein
MRAEMYVGLLFKVFVVRVQVKQTWHVQPDEVQHPTVEFCTIPFSGCRLFSCGLTDIRVDANAQIFATFIENAPTIIPSFFKTYQKADRQDYN